MQKMIVILGAGESGAGSAVLAKKHDFDVFVSDKGQIKEKYKKLLEDHSVEYEEGRHTEKKIFMADEIIKSPGIKENEPLILQLKEKGVTVISENEFAGLKTSGSKICITGSNGKTTVTNLIYHILKKAGKNVVMTGNVGNSFSLSVAEGKLNYYVI